MHLSDILKHKGNQVHTIGPKATLAEAVDLLVENNCGSLMVCEDERMLGIITERDILRALAQVDKPLTEISVESRMTRELVTARPEAPIGEVMGLLTRRRIRHLPVVEKGKMVGMVSIGDVVKAQHHALTMENHYLKEYLMG